MKVIFIHQKTGQKLELEHTHANELLRARGGNEILPGQKEVNVRAETFELARLQGGNEMKETKWTPGPWKLMNSHKAGFVNVYATHDCNSVVDSIATDWICELGPGARDGQSEASCNARLISKAPEMVEALRQCEQVFNVKKIDPMKAFIVIEKIRALLGEITI